MTHLVLLNAIKSVLVVIKDFLLKAIKFLWKYKSIVVVVLSLLVAYFFYQQREEVYVEKVKIEKEFLAYKEIVMLENYKNKETIKSLEQEYKEETERIKGDYDEEISKLQSSLVVTKSNANSLSKALEKARATINTNNNTDSQECKEIREFADTTTRLLETVTARTDYYAEQADRHAIAEKYAVEQHNLLVDLINNNLEVK